MSEPVAWTNKHNLESINKEGAGNVWKEPYFNGDVPLYTHPIRELTDAEIMEIYDRVELYNIDEGQMYLKPIEFAKELLKKANEK
jgi:hypothetical protein